MGLNFFQRRKILKNVNFLDLVPVRTQEHEIMNDGKVCLKVPKFRKKWMRDFFIAGRRQKHYDIYLDELGTATWLEIDGQKNVDQICNALISREGNKVQPFDEIEDRVTKFLSQLYEQRYITFTILQVENQMS